MSPDRDLFANFDRMRREIDELFGDVLGRVTPGPHRRAGFTPPVDLSYREDPPVAVATFALPGIRIEELELEIEGRELRISGHRRPAEAEGSVYQQIEIEHGPFHRVVELGADVIAAETRANYQDGILRVEMPLARRDAGARPVPIQLGGKVAPVRPAGRRTRSEPGA